MSGTDFLGQLIFSLVSAIMFASIFNIFKLLTQKNYD